MNTIELDELTRQGLKKMPVDFFDNVYLGNTIEKALILCIDIRNFSDFLRSNDDSIVFPLIQSFTTNLLSCVNQYGYNCSYYKLMGDGALLIWDDSNQDTIDSALTVFNSYTDFLNDYLFRPYPILGLAGALVQGKAYKYEISAEASQLKYRDYIGYGVNLACRLQGIAPKDSLIVNQKLGLTGLVPVKPFLWSDTAQQNASLKGLRDEDRDQFMLYDRQ